MNISQDVYENYGRQKHKCYVLCFGRRHAFEEPGRRKNLNRNANEDPIQSIVYVPLSAG